MTMKREGHTSLGKEAGKLVLYAALCAFTYNAFAPKGIPLIPPEVNKQSVSDSSLFGHPTAAASTQNSDSVAKAVKPGTKNETFHIISLGQFKRLRAENRGILFDARTAEDFAVSRISGAKNIPGQDAPQHFDDVAELPRDTLLIIYCNNPDCHLGRFLAEFLNALEFKNILLYDDGWDGWLAAKEPIDTVRIRK
jgi:rhodanese-related sulfurtransferase